MMLDYRRQLALLDAVERTREDAERAGEALRASIIAAVAAGASQESVARRAHLTRSRISQIVSEERGRA